MENIEIENFSIPYLSGQEEYSEVLWKDRDWNVKMRETYVLPLTVVSSVWKFFDYDKEKAIDIFEKLSKQRSFWNILKSE